MFVWSVWKPSGIAIYVRRKAVVIGITDEHIEFDGRRETNRLSDSALTQSLAKRAPSLTALPVRHSVLASML